MLYHFLRFLLGIGIRIYYKEVKIISRNELENDGPTIIIANHPNTLMDALIVGYVSKRPIYFMAKGTFFTSNWKSWILKNLNMIPINRKGEKSGKGVSNQDSFEACYKLLEEGKTIAIFPEGSSYHERKLRELKLGAAKIALEAENRNAGKLNLKIQPMGINYQKAEQFRSSVLVKLGKGISMKSYLNDYKVDGNTVVRKVTSQLRTALERLLVNIDTQEGEVLAERLVTIFESRYLNNSNGVVEKIAFLKAIQHRIEGLEVSKPYLIEELNSKSQLIVSKLDKYNVPSDFLDRRFRLVMFVRQLFLAIVLLIIGLPLFLYGFFHNIITYKLSGFLVPKITKEVEYFAPIYLLLGMILYPINYTLFMLVVKNSFDLSFYEQLGYFLTMPIIGLVSYSIYNYFKHIKKKWLFIYLMVKHKNEILQLQTEKDELRRHLFED